MRLHINLSPSFRDVFIENWAGPGFYNDDDNNDDDDGDDDGDGDDGDDIMPFYR